MTFGKKKRRFRSFGGYTIRQAQETLNQLKAEKAEERRDLKRGIIKKEDMTFAEFAEKKFLPTDQKNSRREKTMSSHKTSLSTLLPFFGETLLSHITTEDVDNYIAERKKAKVRKKSKSGFKFIERNISNASINREITFLKQVLKLACKYGYIRTNPAADVEKYPEPPRWTILEDDEVRRLLEAASPKLRPILKLLVTTGMRKNEALRLRWAFPGYERHRYQDEKEARSVLDLEKGFIYIPAEVAKNHKARTIDLSQDLIDMFKGMQKAHSEAKENPKKEKKWGQKPEENIFGIKDIKRSFENMLKRVNEEARKNGKPEINRFRIHDLRHTAASRMIEAGVNVVVVSQILGHSDLKITMKYCHDKSESKRQAVEIMSGIYLDSRQKVDTTSLQSVTIRPVSPERMLH